MSLKAGATVRRTTRDTGPRALDFRVLGPLEARAGGRPLQIAGRKPRALLAFLLVRANEVVPTDALLEALWPEGAPARALNALQVHVSGLRKLLGPGAAERLETRGSGYALALAPGELDRDRFVALVADGRAALAAGDPARAGATLREALEEWRGQALADFLYEPFAQPEIARLEDLRLTALEERVEVDLALGRHAGVVGELEALVGEHPLRERLRGQLMLALYRSGRQAEALAVYQETRRVLVDELGIDPSPPLRALEAAILRHDESLAVPLAAPAPAAVAAPEPAEARKVVTVLVCDAAGAAALAERLDPEALRRAMSRWFEAVSATVARHEGTVERFLGDTVTAVFGIPRLHEDDALRAVRAAFELRDALAPLDEELERAWGGRLGLRVGIEAGEVIAGGPAGPHPSVTGGVVSVAAQLQESAPAGAIVVGRDAYRLVAGAISAEPAEPSADGAFVALGLAEPGAAYPPRFETPIVGRDAERALVAAAFERACGARACRTVTVLGAAGVGKSRLAAETAAALADRATVLAGRCLPYGEGVTFRPVRDLVRQAAGWEEAVPPSADALARVAALVAGEPDADVVTERLGQLLGLAEGTATSEETFWAVRRTLEALARRRPLVVVLEDLHWAQPTFLDLVEYVRDWTHDAPLLVLALARPELLDARPSWGRRPGDELVFLEPLGDAESAELLDRLLGAETLRAEERARIAEAAEGNPLFLEQLHAMVAERNGTDGALAIPPTIHALLAARLDGLEREERAIVERAAVMGRTFSWEAVGALVSEEARPRVGERLSALVRRELLSPDRASPAPEHAFRFRHVLIRDAAYAALPKEARADFHERFADWLRGKPGEHDETLGYHLEQAVLYRRELAPGDPDVQPLADRAAAHLAVAGGRALGRGDVAAAVALLERAASLYEPGRPERLELLPTLAKAVRELGELARAEAIAGDAVAEARAAGDGRVEALARIERASLRDYIDPASTLEELTGVAEEAIAVFEELGDDHGLAEALRLLAEVHWTRGHYAVTEEVVERALGHAASAGDERARIALLTAVPPAALLGPSPVAEALARCERVQAEPEAAARLQAVALAASAWLLAMRADFDAARERCAASRELLERFGFRSALAALPLYSAPVELLAGDPEAAERELRGGYEVLEAMGDRSRLSSEAAFLASALEAQRRDAEADAIALVAAEAASAHDVYTQAAWRFPRARVLARRGEAAEAEALAREAVRLAEETDSLDLQGESLLALAAVLAEAPREEEAARAAADAAGRFSAKGNVVSAGRAEALARRP